MVPLCSVDGTVWTGAKGHEKVPSVARRGLSVSSFASGSARTASRHPALQGGRSHRNADPAAITHRGNIVKSACPVKVAARVG